jgi:predicted PurR-regulated permease PerM
VSITSTPAPAPPRHPLLAWLRQFAGLWGFALFIVLLVVLFRAVILPFALGLLLAYVLAPLVRWLGSGSRRMPRWAAVIAVYVLLAGGIAAFATAFLPHLSADFARLFRETPRFFSRVKRDWVPRADAWLDRNFPLEGDRPAGPGGEEQEPRPERKLVVNETKPGRYEVSLEGLELEVEAAGKGRFVIGPRSDADSRRPRLSDLLGQAASATESELKSILSFGQRFVASVIKTVAWIILTFFVAAYVLIDLERVMGFLRSLVPERHRTAFEELMSELDRGLAGVVRGQLTICLVNAVLTTAGLLIFHVKYAVLLGMLAGVMSFIPVFGTILSSVPIIIVALASGGEEMSLGTGLGVLAWIVGIHFLEANLFNPKIVGTAARIHPVVIVFALLVGEQTGGLVGALLAVPIASIVQGMFLFFRRRAPVETAT